jgi:ATP-binding cassette, subfamily B, multidrug efflux pump
VFVNLIGAYIPQLIKSTVDSLKDLEQKEFILNSLLLIVLLSVVMAIIRVYSRQVIFGIGRQIEFDLKKDIFNHVIKLQPSFFNQQKTGDLISIMSNDVQALRGLGGFAMLNVINTLIAFVVIIPLMFKLHVMLTWCFLGLIPLVLLFVFSLSAQIKLFQQKVQEKLGLMSNFLEANLSGIHIIKAYAQEESEINRFDFLNKSLKNNYISLVKVRSLIGPVMRVIASVGFVLLMYIGGKGIISKTFSPGDFAAYSLYIQKLIWPVATLGWLVTIIYRAQVSYKRIQDILAIKPTINDSFQAINLKSFNDKISIPSLDINLIKGQNIAIIGTIGSGKSTLANKLMRLIEINDNEIFIDGIDIKNISLSSLRSLINIVPQENFLFSTSIHENIAYARDLERDDVIYLAKLVCIHDEIMNLPEAYESIIGERGVTLSGGQRQRIAIARALAINPEILILDDALSSLDNESSEKILKNILEIRKNKTTIFITHKIKIIYNMDLILVMDKNKVVEQGNHKELYLKENSIYRDLLLEAGLKEGSDEKS